MQQTTGKYKLNLIDTSDPFSPDALNKNTEAIEAALIEHETTVSAALSQHKSETDAALATQKSQLEANHNALRQTVAAVEKGAFLYKLGGATAAANQTVTFDLSGVNMNDYAALLLFGSAIGDGSSSSAGAATILYVNNVQVTTIMGDLTKNSTAGLTLLQPISSYVMATVLFGVGNSEGQSSGDSGKLFCARRTQSWAGITNLSAFCNAYTAAADFTLYGLKK